MITALDTPRGAPIMVNVAKNVELSAIPANALGPSVEGPFYSCEM
jgi:hypothetical protein